MTSPEPQVVKIPIKGDEDLERLIAGARSLGYTEAIADISTMLSDMSKKWPDATIELIGHLQALQRNHR